MTGWVHGWLPGMEAEYDDGYGGRKVRVYSVDGHNLYLDEDLGGVINAAPGNHVEPVRDDPCTIGGVLELVRRVYGDTGRAEVRDHVHVNVERCPAGVTVIRSTISDGDVRRGAMGEEETIGFGDTEFEACKAALDARKL